MGENKLPWLFFLKKDFREDGTESEVPPCVK